MNGSDEKKDEPLTSPEGTNQPAFQDPSEAPSMVEQRDASLGDLEQRYHILEEVGRGGMGIVYKARDRETDEVVALKVLRPEIAARSDLVERFRSELRLARKITHKNVCRTHELMRFGDTVAIAMEFVDGESLRAILESSGGVRLRRGLEWARQICSTLVEAHAQGVVHRDLKPENILITREGSVKVMDFGIARSVEADATIPGAVIGTPAYMSPEQAKGKPSDARSDIYSLGLIFYEIFTGRRAFQAETVIALIQKQLHETPRAPSSLEPYLPEFLDQAIQKCLEKDPKKRFQSVSQLESALSEERLADAAEETDPAPAEHLSVWTLRDTALLVLGAIGFFCFLNFRDAIFPASKMLLEVDAITARREAENLASRLGRPFPPTSEAQLEYKGERYLSRLLTFLERSRTEDPFGAIAEVELPLYWKVAFTSETDNPVFDRETPPRYVLLNRKGKVEEYSNPFIYGVSGVLSNYKPASFGERREIARNAVGQTCGSLPPPDLTLVETLGGEWEASYTAAWQPTRPPGSSPWAEASLFAEKVIRVNCYFQTAPERGELPGGRLESRFLVVRLPMKLWGGLGLSVVLAIFVLLVVYFGMGQYHRSPVLWKRSPVAIILGLTGVWLLFPAFWGSAVSLPVLLLGALAASGLLLVALVTVENRLRRRLPARIASWVLALRGRLFERSVALAVVRGALAGLALAGLETLVVYLMLVAVLPFSSFIDPAPIGQSITTLSPALFVVSAAFFNGAVVGLIVLGAGWSDAYKGIQKLQQRFNAVQLFAWLLLMATAIGSVTGLTVLGLRLQVGQNLSLDPPFGILILPVVMGVLLAGLFRLYDTLTAIVAVATMVLWTLNYPLLQILKEVGNTAHWGIFIGWAAVLAAAVFVAFRSHLMRGLRKWRAEEFE